MVTHTGSPGPASGRRRPRNRKQQIVAAAARLFRERGYHNVSLAEVAAEVGITAGALYRHFHGKDELLLHAVTAGIEVTDTMARDAVDLDDLVRRAGVMALERRGLAALWQREARHLPEEQRTALRHRLRETADRVAGLVRNERPELDPTDADVIANALLALFASFGIHRITLPKREFERLHHELSYVIAHCAFTTVQPDPAAVAGREAQHTGVELPRRERLLAAATGLFDERGFQSVNINDISAAAGITGTAIYKHFTSKNELLVAALMRGSEQMHGGMAHALATGRTPREALDHLLRSHIGFALDHSHLIGILISERDELPDKERLASYRAQRDYYAVWAKLLNQLRPDLATQVTKITIDTVFAVINNLARTRRLQEYPALPARMVDITSALLEGAPGSG